MVVGVRDPVRSLAHGHVRGCRADTDVRDQPVRGAVNEADRVAGGGIDRLAAPVLAEGEDGDGDGGGDHAGEGGEKDRPASQRVWLCDLLRPERREVRLEAVGLGRDFRGWRQHRILGEDGVLELLERRPGFEPELVDQKASGLPVAIESLNLAPAAV